MSGLQSLAEVYPIQRVMRVSARDGMGKTKTKQKLKRAGGLQQGRCYYGCSPIRKQLGLNGKGKAYRGGEGPSGLTRHWYHLGHLLRVSEPCTRLTGRYPEKPNFDKLPR